MRKGVFSPTDILIPNEYISFELWSVIACDQFTSQCDYWERVKNMVGECPSTLKMIIPEATLNLIDEDKEINKISSTMKGYIKQGVFREVTNSFIYVERTLADGCIRRGLVGAVDLEEYDFTHESGKTASILSSEDTVLDRLPPRIRVRKAASLELPHIITLIADKNNTVIKPLDDIKQNLPLVYNFKLMEGGGYLKGYQVSGSYADNIIKALQLLNEKNTSSRGLMIMGDGNHSLAAAKSYWNDVKESLNDFEKETHPARYALLELNNIYDSAIRFEAIHRVMFNIDNELFINNLTKTIKHGNDYKIQILTSNESISVGTSANSTGEVIEKVQTIIDNYIEQGGGYVDYIHDVDVLKKLVIDNNCVGIILPTVTKPEFFDVVTANGIFPRKSFSIGHAEDKRYYMECRMLV